MKPKVWLKGMKGIIGMTRGFLRILGGILLLVRKAPCLFPPPAPVFHACACFLLSANLAVLHVSREKKDATTRGFRWRSWALRWCKTLQAHAENSNPAHASQFLSPSVSRKRREKRIVSDLLPVLLQGRHRREITSVVDELEFLENTVIRQHIHARKKRKKRRSQ